MAEKCSQVLAPIVNCDSLRSDPTSDFTASGEQHRFTLRRPLGRPPKHWVSVDLNCVHK